MNMNNKKNNMKIGILIQSKIDVITNSSTEIFAMNDAKSTRNDILNIFKSCGAAPVTLLEIDELLKSSKELLDEFDYRKNKFHTYWDCEYAINECITELYDHTLYDELVKDMFKQHYDEINVNENFEDWYNKNKTNVEFIHYSNIMGTHCANMLAYAKLKENPHFYYIELDDSFIYQEELEFTSDLFTFHERA